MPRTVLSTRDTREQNRHYLWLWEWTTGCTSLKILLSDRIFTKLLHYPTQPYEYFLPPLSNLYQSSPHPLWNMNTSFSNSGFYFTTDVNQDLNRFLNWLYHPSQPGANFKNFSWCTVNLPSSQPWSPITANTPIPPFTLLETWVRWFRSKHDVKMLGSNFSRHFCEPEANSQPLLCVSSSLLSSAMRSLYIRICLQLSSI